MYKRQSEGGVPMGVGPGSQPNIFSVERELESEEYFDKQTLRNNKKKYENSCSPKRYRGKISF